MVAKPCDVHEHSLFCSVDLGDFRQENKIGPHLRADFEVLFDWSWISKVVFTGTELQRVYENAHYYKV
jgi:hypothetical protein